MGAVGTSADNSLAESFNATLKREVLQDENSWPQGDTTRVPVRGVHDIAHPNSGQAIQDRLPSELTRGPSAVGS